MNSFVRIAGPSAVFATTAVGILYVTGTIAILSDDERPPVVVSGGSVFINQLVDSKDEERGAFTDIGGDKKKWAAGHTKGKKPKKLTVIVDNSTTPTTECGPKYVHKGITSPLTFGFEPALAGVKTFTAQLGPPESGTGLELQFVFPVDAAQKAGEEFRLELENVTLTSVTIGTTTCDLGPRGRVEIRQRK